MKKTVICSATIRCRLELGDILQFGTKLKFDHKNYTLCHPGNSQAKNLNLARMLFNRKINIEKHRHTIIKTPEHKTNSIDLSLLKL